MNTRLEFLKEQYSFEEWHSMVSSAENLFIWQFALSGNEFPGWAAHRIRPVEMQGEMSAIRSIWKRPEGSTDELLNVNVYECTSVATAREFLVRLLGDFESPQIARLEQALAGDIAFGSPEDTFILFARANLVFLVRNAERIHVPVSKEVLPLDEYLVSKLDEEKKSVLPDIEQFRFVEEKAPVVGINLPLEIKASDPLDRHVWYKFFSPSGEVFVEEGRLTYRVTSEGTQTVTAIAINANRGIVSQRLQFEAGIA